MPAGTENLAADATRLRTVIKLANLGIFIYLTNIGRPEKMIIEIKPDYAALLKNRTVIALRKEKIARMKDYISLRTFDNYIEANIVLNMLQHDNITCHLKDENTITIDPLLSPALGGIKLMVHQTHAERAWQLMEEAEKAYLRTVPCPVCKAHTLQVISVTKKYSCRLAALVSMVLNGQSVEKVKMYQCASCGYDFKNLEV